MKSSGASDKSSADGASRQTAVAALVFWKQIKFVDGGCGLVHLELYLIT